MCIQKWIFVTAFFAQPPFSTCTKFLILTLLISIMKLQVILVVVFALVSYSNAHKCYQCLYYENTTLTQPECDAEQVPETLLIDCALDGYDGDEWQCVKKTGATINEDDKEAKFVSRFCSAGKTFASECKTSDALGSDFGTVEGGLLCYCNEDGCNAAPHLHQIGTLVLAASLIAITLAYFN